MLQTLKEPLPKGEEKTSVLETSSNKAHWKEGKTLAKKRRSGRCIDANET